MAKKETKSEQKLNVEQIINYLKNDLGVTFNYKTEDYARHFLSEHNYYFRLKHYKIQVNHLNYIFLKSVLMLLIVV